MDLFSTKPIEAPQRQFIRLFVTCGQKQFIATVDRTSQNLDTQIADSYAQACFENSQIDDMLVHQFKVKNIKQSGYQVVIPRSMQIGHVLDDQSYISCEIIDLRKKIHVKVEQSGNSKNKNKQDKEEKKMSANLPDVSPPRAGEQNEVQQKTPKPVPQKKDKNQNKQKQNQPLINKQQIEEEKQKIQPQQNPNLKDQESKQVKDTKEDNNTNQANEQQEKKESLKVDEQTSKKEIIQTKEVIKEKPKESKEPKESPQIQEEPHIPEVQHQKDQPKNQKKQQQQPQQSATIPQDNDEGNFGTKKIRKLNNEEQAVNISKELPSAPNTSFQQNVEHTQKPKQQNNNNQQNINQNKQQVEQKQNNQNQQQQKNKQQGQQQNQQNPQPQQKQQQKPPQQPVKKINKVITTACDTDDESEENVPVVKSKVIQPQKQGKKIDKKHSIDFDNNLFENC